jgi:hypothetical protein
VIEEEDSDDGRRTKPIIDDKTKQLGLDKTVFLGLFIFIESMSLHSNK